MAKLYQKIWRMIIMTLTLDEMIKHFEKIVEEKESEAQDLEYSKLDWKHEANVCLEEAEKYKQIVEWLKELKYYKDRQDLINKSWQELIRYREGIEKVKMRSQSYRECGENILASGMEQALDILNEVSTYDRDTD